jgi:predicted dehydrogenase
VEVVGICDVNPDVRSSRKCLQPFSDIVEMIEVTSPTAVVMSLPHSAYFNSVRECSSRGVAVLGEKPLVRSLQEARELSAELALMPGVVAVASQRRHSGVFSCLEREIEACPVAPYAVHCEYALGLETPADGWRLLRQEAGGGALLDMGYHVFDLLTALLGLPSDAIAFAHRVSPHKSIVPDGVENAATVLLRYTSGTVATVLVGRELRPKDERMTVWLQTGRIEQSNGEVWREGPSGRELLVRKESSQDLLHAQLHEFVLLIRLGMSTSCLLTDAMKTAETIEMVYASMQPSSLFNWIAG